jgi:signal transduction histidine kinase/CheY-like chemotaxis protein
MEPDSRDQELAEALEQQRVTAGILRAIANSSTDPAPIFDTIVTSATRLCQANFAFVMLNEGGRLVLAARTDCTPEFAAFLQGGKPPNRATTTGRAALERRPVQVLDFLAEPGTLVTEAHRAENVRTVLAVPMCRGDQLLGVMSVWRREVRAFSERQVQLLETFANQAVIALENVRLFREAKARNGELAEALEQQTATSEVLKVISRSRFELEPVLHSLVEYATKLCAAEQGFIFRRDEDGYRLAVAYRAPPDFREWRQADAIQPGDGTMVGRVALAGRAVQIVDTREDREWLAAHRNAPGIGVVRTLLGVPMLRENVPIGVICLWRTAVQPFTDKQIDLITTFADQAVIAIENVRLFRELEARNREIAEALDQQTATAEILRAISGSPTDALPVFDAIVRNAVALCGSLFANVFRYDGELLHYVASHNTGPSYVELLQAKYPMRPDASQVSGRVLLNRAVVRLEDARADPHYDQRFPTAMGWRRMLGVPMLRDGQPLGAIVVGWAEAGPIPKATEDLLRTFADQAVIAIENVRLFEESQDKTRQLELANAYKSRFLAAASHDLRQPLHALNLFVAQLHAECDPAERNRLVGRIDAAVGAMNELFNALLDMSKLEAGMLETELTEFPVERLLKHMETTFAGAAQENGLRLSVVPSAAWVRSDFILLERILLNLASNAVRYTTRGGIVIGCRRRGARLRLEVWDSGPGIPEDHHRNIFREFYQLAGAGRDRRGGLGLGLAIVDGLGRLLDHPVELKSRPGRGSCFSVSVPRAAAQREPSEAPAERARPTDPLSGKLVVVIDDDALVLDGMRGILRSWGCGVVTEPSAAEALARLTELGSRPDVIISDYRLANGKTGIEAIERLRGALGAAIPAFLISGDTAPERLRDAGASGYHLLHKPVPPMALRAMLNGLLRPRDGRVPFRAALREASRRSSAGRALARRPR